MTVLLLQHRHQFRIPVAAFHGLGYGVVRSLVLMTFPTAARIALARASATAGVEKCRADLLAAVLQRADCDPDGRVAVTGRAASPESRLSNVLDHAQILRNKREEIGEPTHFPV